MRKWSTSGLSACSVCEMKESHHTCPESRETRKGEGCGALNNIMCEKNHQASSSGLITEPSGDQISSTLAERRKKQLKVKFSNFITSLLS